MNKERTGYNLRQAGKIRFICDEYSISTLLLSGKSRRWLYWTYIMSFHFAVSFWVDGLWSFKQLFAFDLQLLLVSSNMLVISWQWRKPEYTY